MWTRALLKENGKVAFKRNYWPCVGVSVLAGLLGVSVGGGSVDLNLNSSDTGSISMGTDLGTVDGLFSSIPDYVWTTVGVVMLIAGILGLCFGILVTNVAKIGCDRYFMENREHKTEIGNLFYGFKNGRYGSNVYITFMRDLIIFGHTLLLIVPGIIKAYSYSMVSYILAENSDLDRERVLKISSDMMKGHKMELFVLELSFIGWNILSTFTGGILGIFYVNPYIWATKAEFYSAVKAEAIGNGLVSPSELPGVKYPEQTVEQTVEW